MSPFLTCFPLLPTAEPFGQGNTRLSHIKRRRLIMPLVALVQKITAHPQLRTLVWCSALPSSSPLLLAFRHATYECLSKNALNKFLPKTQYLDEERGNKNPTDRSVLVVRDCSWDLLLTKLFAK